MMQPGRDRPQLERRRRALLRWSLIMQRLRLYVANCRSRSNWQFK